jgi:hypothetical protein
VNVASCSQVARYWEDPSNVAAAIIAGIDILPPDGAPSRPDGTLGQDHQKPLQVSHLRAAVGDLSKALIYPSSCGIEKVP